MLKYIALALALIVASPAVAQSLNGNTIPPGSINPFPAQSPNTVYAGPTSGANAFPSFRALVPADIPTGSATRNLNWLSPTDPQFGAKCDGTTDDHTALTAWAAALGAGSTGYVPGVCLTSTGITFQDVNNLAVFGNGVTSELRYTGASTTATPFQFGGAYNACATSGLRIENLVFSSSTNMTAGSGVKINEACNAHINGVFVQDANFQSTHWYQAIEIHGGNEIYVHQYQFVGTNIGLYIYGDSSVQLSDIYLNQGKIYGGTFGVDIAGNVGGFNADDGDWLLNGSNLRISQDAVAVANSQIFLGAKLALDATSVAAGTNGRDIDVVDAGGNNSILTMAGTWLSSSKGYGLTFDANVQWEINWTGGSLINATSDGVNIGTGAIISGAINGVVVNATAAGFGGWIGYGFNCAGAQANLVIENIKFVSAPTSGLVSGCALTSYFPPNGNSPIFVVPLDNTTGPATSWQYDTSGQGVIAVANGANVALPASASGLVMVTNQTDGNVGVYLCGGGACALTSQSKTSFDTSTTTPASGKASIAWTGSAYAIYNNTGASVSFNASLFKTRNST